MLKSKNILTLSIALAAFMAAPSAFAQDAAKQDAAKTAESQDAMAQQAIPPTAEQADKSAEPAKKSWSELDVNSNGSLSASEASPMESLAKVFGEADADADGELTQDEYKAWLAANSAKQQPNKQGG